MTAAEILVKIRTFFDRKGATEATDALKQTAATAKQTGQQVTQAGQSGSDGLNVMSAATAAMNGNFAGTATALVPLITKIKALGAAMTSVSLVMAGLTLVYMAFNKIAEYATKAADAVAAFNAKSRADMIEAVTNSYNKQAIAMERISTLRDAELERTLATNEANKVFELATARQAKLKELQGVTDESKKADIEAKYARVEQQITANYSAKNDQAEYSRMKKSEDDARKKSDAEALVIRQKRALLRRAEQDEAEAAAKVAALNEITPTSLVSYGLTRGVVGVKEKEAIKAKEQADALRKEIETHNLKRISFDDEANRIGGLRPSAQRRMSASALERENASAALDLSDADKARQKEKNEYTSFESLRIAAAQTDTQTQKTLQEEVNRLFSKKELTADAINNLTETLGIWAKSFETGDAMMLRALEDHKNRMRNIQ